MSTQTPRPRLTDDVLLELHAHGIPVKEIAARCGVNPRTVQRHKKSLGLDLPLAEHAGRRATPERLAAAADLLADGAPRREVARTLGMHFETIRRHFPDARTWSPVEVSQYARLVRELNRIKPVGALRGVTETEQQ